MNPEAWLASKGMQAFPFQLEVWQAMRAGRSGLLIAPTGTGKTLAVWAGALEVIASSLANSASPSSKGISILWITPLRALATDTLAALNAFDGLHEPEPPASSAGPSSAAQPLAALLTGDTPTATRKRLWARPPPALVTTPESLAMMLSRANTAPLLNTLRVVIVDEWHSLLGSKRGVHLQLLLAELIARVAAAEQSPLIIWGLSATLADPVLARDVLLHALPRASRDQAALVQVTGNKAYEVKLCLPSMDMDTPVLERVLPWAGHLGRQQVTAVADALASMSTALVFTNTRRQAEYWYQALLEERPDWAGLMALHHGAMATEQRQWVEEALKVGTLKVVVCTATLDLGVDFSPVEWVVQIGSAKGLSRLLQRVGRSGHAPGETSRLCFVPTHALELFEALAIQALFSSPQTLAEMMEPVQPWTLCMDVLIQHLVTLACGEGFVPVRTLEVIRRTHAYADLTDACWQQALQFITNGGAALAQYPEFHRVVDDAGRYRVLSTRLQIRHRQAIGTIVSELLVSVRFVKGGVIGSIEEQAVETLKPLDVFIFAGRHLQLVRREAGVVWVRLAKAAPGVRAVTWRGGRMPLSTRLAEQVLAQWERWGQYRLASTVAVVSAGTGGRSAHEQVLDPRLRGDDECLRRNDLMFTNGCHSRESGNPGLTLASEASKQEGWSSVVLDPRLRGDDECLRGDVSVCLAALVDCQRRRSALPTRQSLLVEWISSREGEHLFVYPFAGRAWHAALATRLTALLLRHEPLTLSMAVNDDGFELLAPAGMDWADCWQQHRADWLNPSSLQADLQQTLGESQWISRRFREIAQIAGLVHNGPPHARKAARQVQASSQLYLEVFRRFEPDHLLLRQAEREVLQHDFDLPQLASFCAYLLRLSVNFQRPRHWTPLSFPLMASRLRETMSSEKLADRLRREMQRNND